MSLRTFLGPLLAGTQKNNNAAVVTSNTPSASYLLNGTGGSYRNTGAQDCFQFISIPQATLTGIAAASYPYTFIPTYSVSGVNYPVVIPAGSYIDNIDFIVNTQFATGATAPSSLAIAIQLVGAPGTTYATAQTIATVTQAITSNTSTTNIGVYATANSGTTASATNPLVYTASATPLAMLQNTGPTDVMLQLVMTFTGGTNQVISAGAFGLAFNYVLRSPDGSWYPQTPPVPYSQPSPGTY